MDLNELGWTEDFNQEEVKPDELARIVAVHRSHLRAITNEGEINLHYSGGSAELPAVGDWVSLTPRFIDEQNKPAAIIKSILPRKSKFSRVGVNSIGKEQTLAANVDLVFIVTSLNQDFNINRLERFVLLVKEGNAQPIIIISKTDLCENLEESMEAVTKQLPKDISVLATSSLKLTGINKLKSLMPIGSTSVFVGSSGVGKSSLVNRLLGQEIQSVKEIRKDDDKGRHATTARQMFFVPEGGMIIDTPGIREVTVFGAETSLAETFSDLDILMAQCKFSDCSHSNEKGCAVVQALDTGELSEKQWNHYQKLQKEMEFNNRKMDKAEASNSKKRWKKINQNYRARKKFEGRD